MKLVASLKKSFALPVVIVTSTILLAVISFVLRSVSTGKIILSNQHYQLLARQAAESGIAMAEACIKKDNKVSWSDSRPLKPNTDCSGNNPSGNAYVIGNINNLRTYFEVRPLSGANTSGAEVKSEGFVNVYNSGGVLVRTFRDSTSAYSQYGMSSSIPPTPLKVSFMGKTVNSGVDCGISLTGDQLLCWGSGSGYFGTNSSWRTEEWPVNPIKPTGVTGWKSYSGANYRTCALATNNQIYCWGWDLNPDIYNSTEGFLGTGQAYQNSSVSSSSWLRRCALVPVKVSNPSGAASWKAIAVSITAACAIGADNQLYCWGGNDQGGLGIGSSTTTTTKYLATKISSPSSSVSGWKEIDMGDSSACALSTSATASFNNQIYCWGSNYQGQLGIGSVGVNSFANRATKVVNPNGVTSWKTIALGRQRLCAIANDNNQVYCAQNSSPYGMALVAKPAGAGTWLKIVHGSHGCTLDSTGNVYCWGTSVGDGTSLTRATPTLVVKPPTVIRWKDVSSTMFASCAIAESTDPMNNDRPFCWGDWSYVTTGAVQLMTHLTEGDKPLIPQPLSTSYGSTGPPIPSKFIRF